MTGDAAGLKKVFPQGHIPVVLLAILDAGHGIRKKAINEREDRITTRLYKATVRIPIFRDGPLDIRPQPEIVAPETDDDKVSGKIDLLVSCGLGNEVYFAIEAKKLRVQFEDGKIRSLSSDYVKDGMMRFVNGQYAPFMESGAMLGYVFDGDLVTARAGIDRSIKSKATKLRLMEPHQLQPSTILSGKPVDETRHALTGRNFTIYHLLVAV